MNPVQKIAVFDCDNTASLFTHSLNRIKATCSTDERKDLIGIALVGAVVLNVCAWLWGV